MALAPRKSEFMTLFNADYEEILVPLSTSLANDGNISVMFYSNYTAAVGEGSPQVGYLS